MASDVVSITDEMAELALAPLIRAAMKPLPPELRRRPESRLVVCRRVLQLRAAGASSGLATSFLTSIRLSDLKGS